MTKEEFIERMENVANSDEMKRSCFILAFLDVTSNLLLNDPVDREEVKKIFKLVEETDSVIASAMRAYDVFEDIDAADERELHLAGKLMRAKLEQYRAMLPVEILRASLELAKNICAAQEETE